MRRTERIASNIPVRWVRKSIVEATAADINVTGIFLKTDEVTTPGSLMQLELLLPDGPLTVFGAARFVGATQSGVGIGVEFMIIDELALNRWSSYYHAQVAAVRHRHETFARASNS